MKIDKRILFLLSILVISCLGLGVTEYFVSVPSLENFTNR